LQQRLGRLLFAVNLGCIEALELALIDGKKKLAFIVPISNLLAVIHECVILMSYYVVLIS